MRQGYRIDWLLVTLFAVPVVPFGWFLLIALDPALHRWYDFALTVLFGMLLASGLLVNGIHILENRPKALPSSLLAVTIILAIASTLAHRAIFEDRPVQGERNSGSAAGQPTTPAANGATID